MKIRNITFSALIVAFALSCCTTSRSVVSDHASLGSYHYATLANVMDYSGSAALLDLEVKIYDALVSTRLTVIGDRQINELSATQKEQLLLVRFSASQRGDEAIVSVNFTDYTTGKPVASCRGAFGFGLTPAHGMEVAIERVAKQIKALF